MICVKIHLTLLFSFNWLFNFQQNDENPLLNEGLSPVDVRYKNLYLESQKKVNFVSYVFMNLNISINSTFLIYARFKP